jgi:hypothetical protein
MNRLSHAFTTTLGALALLTSVACITLALGNAAQRRELAEQQAFVQQSAQLEGLYREMVRALAELAARSGDEPLRALLQRHGISYTAQAPAVPPPTGKNR